jgi:hypothetical protein
MAVLVVRLSDALCQSVLVCQEHSFPNKRQKLVRQYHAERWVELPVHEKKASAGQCNF